MAGTTFTFGGTDIKTIASTGTEIIITSIKRPLKRPTTRHKVEIPGRPGAWDFGGGVARDYIVSVEIIIIGETSSKMLECARAIDTLLTGKDALVFSDDPTVTHQAQVFEGITLEPQKVSFIARATIIFECDA